MPQYAGGGGGGGGSGDGSFWMPVRVTADTEDCVVGVTAIFALPFSATVNDLGGSVSTAPTGSLLKFDVFRDDGGGYDLVGEVEVDANEKSSTDALNPPVIADDAIAAGDLVKVELVQVGSTVPGKGCVAFLKLTPT